MDYLGLIIMAEGSPFRNYLAGIILTRGKRVKEILLNFLGYD